MPTLTAEQRKAHNRAYYEKNKDGYRERNQSARKRAADYVNKIKESTPCKDCGLNYPHYVMDFDHLSDDKDRKVSSLVNASASNKRLQAEIDKCELVCSNCHRVRTQSRLSMPL